MKLYHGTNGAWLDSILRTGIRPRGSRKGNWEHNSIHSNRKCVYLTDSYAPYFALNATRGQEPSCAVIEVDTDRLDDFDLFPDEDFLEQASRNYENGPKGDMKRRTMYYRKRQFEYGSWLPCASPDGGETTWWEASLKYLGTCSHHGLIPPDAITGAVSWPHRPNIHVAFVWDPSISLVNQKIMGDRYRVLTRKLMAGEFTSIQELRDIHERRLTDSFEEYYRDPPLPVIEGWACAA